MAAVWRMHTLSDGNDLGEYCLENNIIAMGWSLMDSHMEALAPIAAAERAKRRKNIASYDDYAAFVAEYGVYGGKVNSNVYNLRFSVNCDDLVWIRKDGLYYLGRITSESRWRYCGDDEAVGLDASNQVDHVEWHLIGDESDVPGAVTTSLIRGKTLQHIWKYGVLELSQILYNDSIGEEYYKISPADDPKKLFYSLLSPFDCEDLLCMWLYHEKGYICIPSSNKTATELYECVLVDPATGKHIYPQVKAGDVDLYAADYRCFDGDVWLFTTRGKVIMDDHAANVSVADPDELFKFAGSADASKILPSSISKWRKWLEVHQIAG